MNIKLWKDIPSLVGKWKVCSKTLRAKNVCISQFIAVTIPTIHKHLFLALITYRL